MNGKGDKRRPTIVDQETFDNNWEKVFGKKTVPMWEHDCKHNGKHSTESGESCNWCGVKEDGSFD